MSSVVSSSINSFRSQTDLNNMISGAIPKLIIGNIIQNLLISLLPPFQFIVNAMVFAVNIGQEKLYILAFSYPLYDLFCNIFVSAISAHALKDVQKHIVNQRYKAGNIYLSYAFFQGLFLSLLSSIILIIFGKSIIARFTSFPDEIYQVLLPQAIGGVLGTGTLPMLKALIFLDNQHIFTLLTLVSIAVQVSIFQISLYYFPSTPFLSLGISFLIQNLILLIYGLFSFLQVGNFGISRIYKISFRSIRPIKAAIFIKISIFSLSQLVNLSIQPVSLFLAYFTGTSYVGNEAYYAEINIFLANFYVFYNQFCCQYSEFQVEQLQNLLITNKEMDKEGRVYDIVLWVCKIGFLVNLVINFVLYFTVGYIVDLMFNVNNQIFKVKSAFYYSFVDAAKEGLWIGNLVGVIAPFSALGKILVDYLQDQRLFEIYFISGWFTIVAQFILFAFSSFKINSYSVIFIVQVTQQAASIVSFLILLVQLKKTCKGKIPLENYSIEDDADAGVLLDDAVLQQSYNTPLLMESSNRKGSLLDVLTSQQFRGSQSSQLNDLSMTKEFLNPQETSRFLPLDADKSQQIKNSLTFDFNTFKDPLKEE